MAAIDDLATLVDRWLAVLEDDSLTLEVERVLDGASRLAAIDPTERAARMAPVVARAKKLLKRPWPGTIAGDLARLALAWSGAAYEEAEARDDVGRVFGARVERIAERLTAGRAAALLSAPTHEAGFVDPSALVARVAHVGVDAFDVDDVVDQGVGRLRLAPWGREAALQAAARLKSELGLALRHALGGKVAVGPTAALWIAAARARHPDGDDAAVAARHPGLGPDAAEVARHTWTSRPYATTWDELAIAVAPAVPRKVPLAHVAVGLHGEGRRDGRRAGSELGLVRWALTLCPRGSEALFAEGATALFSDLYNSEPEKYLHAFLEPLAEAWTALGPMAVLCLTVGLASKAPDERLRAVDALARAVDDGRLDAAALGATLACLLLTQRAVAGRWAKSLGEVARLSPRHARAVVEVVTAALRGEVERAPKDIGVLLELLFELLVELDLGLTDADARAWLDALAAARGGKGRALARSVLARG
ncbi:MAG: DUF6493 family protein [Myxococcota bacterium]